MAAVTRRRQDGSVMDRVKGVRVGPFVIHRPSPKDGGYYYNHAEDFIVTHADTGMRLTPEFASEADAMRVATALIEKARRKRLHWRFRRLKRGSPIFAKYERIYKAVIAKEAR